jgi:hypothetical protein
MIWLLPSSVSKLSLFLSLYVFRWSSKLTEEWTWGGGGGRSQIMSAIVSTYLINESLLSGSIHEVFHIGDDDCHDEIHHYHGAGHHQSYHSVHIFI